MSEQRLIDANALEKILSQRYKEMEAKNGPYDHYVSGFDDAITYVEDAPTIDAVPVVHAFWRHIGGDEWCCTDCALVISTEGSWEKPWQAFCPNCGAKMDGGATDV